MKVPLGGRTEWTGSLSLKVRVPTRIVPPRPLADGANASHRSDVAQHDPHAI